MAFGKKKDGEAGSNQDESVPDQDEATSDLENDADPLDDDDDVGSGPSASAATYGTTMEKPAAAQTIAVGPPEASDALLSIFQPAASDDEKQSALIDLVADIDIADVLEDMHTLAAAMGLRPRGA